MIGDSVVVDSVFVVALIECGVFFWILILMRHLVIAYSSWVFSVMGLSVLCISSSHCKGLLFGLCIVPLFLEP